MVMTRAYQETSTAHSTWHPLKKKTGINIITIDDGELLRCPNHSCKELAQLLQNASELEFEKL